MTDIDQSIRSYRRLGLATLLLGLGGAAAWAATVQLSGAVVATGTVVVESSVKRVQHASGGIVGEILVKDGAKVQVGDILVKLDQTMARANLQIINQQIDELEMRDARLELELSAGPLTSDLPDFAFPRRFADRGNDPSVATLYVTEKIAYDARRSTCSSQNSQYEERITQLKEEAAGLEEQIKATKKEINFIRSEIDGLEQLESKQLVPKTKMVERKREEARLVGQHSQLRASAAQARGRIAEIELQKSNHFQQLRTVSVNERRETQTKLVELKERQIAAQDQLKRTDIRSPQTGFVHELSVHTVGGVLAPGEQIMLIVPDGDDLSVEVAIEPNDISQVSVGQKSMLRFSGLHNQLAPEIAGTVTRVGADLSKSESGRAQYFMARISVDAAERTKIKEAKIVPGMPVEVFVETNTYTAMSYLVKPIADQFRRALREG
ncbi:MAG: HlyD family type I secretion periplasmic adaptor subunit [Hyphomicrobium sp.]|nr:HlyD family type I secretion periplasmic adaptor subunit [Hyphomicrobium sp.]